jgi:phosphoribosylglycinamide formyltransferase 1
MLKAKIAVLVSGGGTNLQALIDAQNSGKIQSGEIALVVSSSETALALKRAEKYSIPSVVVSKKSCGSQAEFEKRIESALIENGIELLVLAGFMSILSADFVTKWENRIINVHPSLIPSFCGEGFYGLSVHEAALKRGVKITGATVHFVNEIPDGGEIILQKSVPVYKSDTPEILQKRVMERAEWIILPRATELVCKKILKEGVKIGL